MANKCVDCGKETDNEEIFGQIICDNCIAKDMEKIDKKIKYGDKPGKLGGKNW